MIPVLVSSNHSSSQSIFRRRRENDAIDELISVALIEADLSRDDFDPPDLTSQQSLKCEKFHPGFLIMFKIFFIVLFTTSASTFVHLGGSHSFKHKVRLGVGKLKRRQKLSFLRKNKPRVISFHKSNELLDRIKLKPVLEVNYDAPEYSKLKVAKYFKKDNDCISPSQWQFESRPTCNSIHEIDFLHGYSGCAKCIHPFGRGGTRDVWLYYPGWDEIVESKVILKTLRMSRVFDENQLLQHNFDAMASEQLTASQYVVDIYGHCGHTVINEYASGGDADRLHKKYPRMSWFQKLGHARDLARGLADVHNLIDGQAAIIHGDLKPCNVMIADNGVLKINDFNNGAPLLKNRKTNQICEVLWPHRCDQEGLDTYMRSPEECKDHQATQKSDVYSLGGLLYYIFSGNKPYRMEPALVHTSNSTTFVRLNQTEISSRIQKGVPPTFLFEPSLYDSMTQNDILAFNGLKSAIQSALIFNQNKRPNAEEIAEFLDKIVTQIQ